MSSWRDYIPVSRSWLNKIEGMDDATDAFQGKLSRYGTVIAHPFWARTLPQVLPVELRAVVSIIVPEVKKQKLGKAPNSTIEGRRNMYCTAAWSTYPCSCQYRYAGFSKHKIGVIGSPAVGSYPLCGTVDEACSIT